jgi:AraC-like DNA-binding protein
MLREHDDVRSFLDSVRGDNLSYRQVFDHIARTVPFTEAVVITTMPRGTLQLVQPMRVCEMLLKSYSKEFHTEDRATWRAVLEQKPVRGEDCWKDESHARFLKEFLYPIGLQYLVAVPLAAPVFDGYPGALHLYRDGEQGPFRQQELDELADLAGQLDSAIARVRDHRRPEECKQDHPWDHRPAVRQFIFSSRTRLVYGEEEFEGLDPTLQEEMVRHVRHLLQNDRVEPTQSDRVLLPDSSGDNWVFRVVAHEKYPALGDGPYVFFCLQPGFCDWAAVRQADFQADPELSRLMPTLKFMQDNFQRSPTLVETSAVVHLSPFHFHRRFTELLGLTPKHFLLECQIWEAKRQLLARQKDLPQLAADCGFAHQSHFTSRFKQATGLTPTRWRKMAWQKQTH